MVEQIAHRRFADGAGDWVATEGVARPELHPRFRFPQNASLMRSAMRIAESGA